MPLAKLAEWSKIVLIDLRVWIGTLEMPKPTSEFGGSNVTLVSLLVFRVSNPIESE